MSSRPLRRRRDATRALIGAAFALAAAVPRAVAADRDLLLAVELNNRPLEIVVHLTERNGVLLLERDDLDALGLAALAADPDAGPQIPLHSVRGVATVIDEARQMLLITAADSALKPQTIGETRTLPKPDAAGFGAVVNYDLFGSYGATRAFDSLLEERLHSPWGTLSNSTLAEWPGGQVLRLATAFTHWDYPHDRSWQAGDVVTGGLAWTRPFRLGGAQVQTLFAMRPDLITYPLPDLSGRVAVPSSVDVMVNGVRQLSENVQSGPFSIRQPPLVTGAGDVKLVTQDVFGQQSVQTIPFYVSPALLAPGLHSYSVEAGRLRTGFGRLNDRYGDAVASGSLRVGVWDWMTAEAHAEASSRVQMGGGGVLMNAAGLGVVSLAAATSRQRPVAGVAGKRTGAQYSVGFERNAGMFSAGINYASGNRGFADIPASAGDPVPRQTLRATVGLNLPPFGTIRAAWVSTIGGLVPIYSASQRPTLAAGNAQIGTLTYTRPIGDRVTFYATAFRDFSSSTSAGITFGISLPLGATGSFGAAVSAGNRRPSAEVDASRAASVPGDLGLRAHLGSDPNNGESADATYMSSDATSRLGIERVGRRNNARAELQGSLVFTEGRLFTANRIGDSYAVVDTGGQADVPVLLENRPVGRTGPSGLLLIPYLRGWDENRLSIDPTELPADVETETLNVTIRPPGSSGMTVPFHIRRGASALLRLVTASGAPVPVGSTAIVRGSGRHLPVGFDGEVFASDLREEEALRVITAGGECVATFRFQPAENEIPTIGPIACVPTEPR